MGLNWIWLLQKADHSRKGVHFETPSAPQAKQALMLCQSAVSHSSCQDSCCTCQGWWTTTDWLDLMNSLEGLHVIVQHTEG